MFEECPHCGTTLQRAVDAFCPECRRPLDEAPLIRRLDDKVRKVAWPDVDFPGLISLFLGLALVMSFFVDLAIWSAKARSEEWEWYETAKGVLGLVLLGVGVWRLCRPGWSLRPISFNRAEDIASVDEVDRDRRVLRPAPAEEAARDGVVRGAVQDGVERPHGGD